MQHAPAGSAQQATRSPIGTRFGKWLIFDLAERVVVLALFGLFVHRMVPRLTELAVVEWAYPQLLVLAADVNAQVVLLVLSEALVAALIVFRRPSRSLSLSPFDWGLSFSAVTLPLFAVPPPAGMQIAVQTAVVVAAGLIVQIGAKLSLWRSFGVVPANRGVRTGGLYGVVRHPMYAGYFIAHVGFLLSYPLQQNALVYAAAFGLQLMRIMREETILFADPAYVYYAQRVRYRLIPGLF